MSMEKTIARINELARKKKSVGLTPDELEEQRNLRQIYLENFKKNFRAQLEQIEFVDDDKKLLH